jgi:hypothetical protein
MRVWSTYQEGIFENVRTGTGHTVVSAVPGSGKTTTIEEATNHIPKGLKTLFVAFNKSIATELGRRLQGRPVEVSTLHSYGLKCVTAALGRLRIDGHRVDDFAVDLHGNRGETLDLRRDLAKVVSLAKGTLAATAEQRGSPASREWLGVAHSGGSARAHRRASVRRRTRAGSRNSARR